MKKNYIAPTSEHKLMAAQQMVALSMLSDDEVSGGSPAVGGGQGTGGDTSSDGLVKGQTNVWENEW